MFKYLSIKKEILFLLNNDDDDNEDDAYNNKSWAKVDLTGQIILCQKNKPNISFLFNNNYDIQYEGYNDSNEFHYLKGFNQDKYFIYLSGNHFNGEDSYDAYKHQEFNISIYLTKNFTKVYDKVFYYLDEFKKISDLYFVDEDNIYYYDMKKNEI